MRLYQRSRLGRTHRPGQILVFFVILLPVLLGWVGLVIDGGLLMAAHRQAQNAADAAALATATDKLRGKSDTTAIATGTKFVQEYNGLPGASVVIHIPPSQGPYAGNSQYAEAIVTSPMKTLFIQVLGTSSNQTVQARAVAGFQAVSAGEGAIVLDPTARPGLAVTGGATLYVEGPVIVNSQAAGWNENNQWVDLGLQRYAVITGNNSTIQATDMQVVGGVDTPANIQNIPGNSGSPLHAGALPEPDPLKNLPVPTSGTLGVDLTPRGGTSLSGGTTTLYPGVYDYIWITNNATVTFAPGIYIIASTQQNALKITGGGTITGDGVMFYNTGSNYLQGGAGSFDALDGENLPPAPDNPTFGDVTINAQNVRLTPLNDAQNPFDGMLFYQRRHNTLSIDIQGTASTTVLAGTLYAKWATFKLAGGGKYDAQFIAGSMSVSGQANVTIDAAGKKFGKANRVFLVE